MSSRRRISHTWFVAVLLFSVMVYTPCIKASQYSLPLPLPAAHSMTSFFGQVSKETCHPAPEQFQPNPGRLSSNRRRRRPRGLHLFISAGRRQNRPRDLRPRAREARTRCRLVLGAVCPPTYSILAGSCRWEGAAGDSISHAAERGLDVVFDLVVWLSACFKKGMYSCCL